MAMQVSLSARPLAKNEGKKKEHHTNSQTTGAHLRVAAFIYLVFVYMPFHLRTIAFAIWSFFFSVVCYE